MTPVARLLRLWPLDVVRAVFRRRTRHGATAGPVTYRFRVLPNANRAEEADLRAAGFASNSVEYLGSEPLLETADDQR